MEKKDYIFIRIFGMKEYFRLIKSLWYGPIFEDVRAFDDDSAPSAQDQFAEFKLLL